MELSEEKFGRQADGMTAGWAKEHDVVGTTSVHREQGMKENVGWNIQNFIQLIARVTVGWKVTKDAVAYREGGFGVFNPPPRNSEDIGGVLDRMSKKRGRLDFLLKFTVFSYGCNLLHKGFF